MGRDGHGWIKDEIKADEQVGGQVSTGKFYPFLSLSIY